jgi:arylsulfatase A-like enzyme
MVRSSLVRHAVKRGLARRMALMLAAIAAIIPLPGQADEATPSPPNVIVILVDDLGAFDLGCQGSGFYATPHIDRLAAAGIRFTAGYAACTVCSPTRAALLTGQAPARLHLTDWIAGHEDPQAKLKIPDWQQHLPLEAVTVAERLSEAGYATASIGKWHLGGADQGPEQQGFDTNIAGTDRGQPPSYVSPYKIPTLTDGPAGEYLTDRLTEEAVAFIEANRDHPLARARAWARLNGRAWPDGGGRRRRGLERRAVSRSGRQVRRAEGRRQAG